MVKVTNKPNFRILYRIKISGHENGESRPL